MKLLSFILTLAVILTSFHSPQKNAALKIEKNFVKVNSHILMSKYEITNNEFREFLNNLIEQKEISLYNTYNFDSTKWSEILNADPFKIYYHSNPSYNAYPAVNISHEAAIAYCNWLTKNYLNSEIKSYKKVVFRLPTKQEWIDAATSHNADRIYAWEGNSLRNNKGQKLYNFKTIDDTQITFNFKTNQYEIKKNKNNTILSPANSFFSNSLGLYNVCGNAAEMISEKGISMGGSFNDTGYDVRVISEKNYTSPSPLIGFRVLMEIIEP